VVWQTDHPVRALNLLAGRWQVLRREGTAVFYHPGHAHNVEEISNALVAARRRFSEWFHPYPWSELRLSELPNWIERAQGFPTNLSFSEGFGFLARSEPRTRLAFAVTAHEAAHQWWGNLVTAGKGPGADLLIEGMAQYSALLLMEAEHGLAGRIELACRFEERYGRERRADGERPLVEIEDASRAGDETAIYDRGGWVLWMLDRHLGRERMLAGLRAFIQQFLESDDHPLVEDLLETLRPYAPDPAAYQAFVEQWLFDVVSPELSVSETVVAPTGAGWTVSATVANVGTGTVTVEVAVSRGERFDAATGEALAGYADARQAVRLRPGERQKLSWTTGFKPERIVVDPDAQLFQLHRERARRAL
jgi:aminopeptidase N